MSLRDDVVKLQAQFEAMGVDAFRMAGKYADEVKEQTAPPPDWAGPAPSTMQLALAVRNAARERGRGMAYEHAARMLQSILDEHPEPGERRKRRRAADGPGDAPPCSDCGHTECKGNDSDTMDRCTDCSRCRAALGSDGE